MTDLLFPSLVALSIGSLLCLPLVSVREIGRGFFTLWVCVVGSLGGIALGLRASGTVSAGAGGAAGGDRTALFMATSLVLLAIFWVALRLERHRLAALLLVASAVSGGLLLRELALSPASQRLDGGSWAASSRGGEDERSVASEARRPVERNGNGRDLAAGDAALRVSSLLLSAMAIGIVTVAMVLGHWYLVQPKLAIAPLRRLSDVFIGVLVARLLVSAWGFAASLHQGHRLMAPSDPIPWEALILSQRLLFGFGGSLVLAVMIRKTVALRSTMSATGLLYIAILFVWVGEFLSIYLGQLTGGSLVV